MARPTQAAVFSALSFALGAAVPLAIGFLTPVAAMTPAVAVGSLVCLAVLGGAAARAGGAGIVRGSLRVLFWGAAAMAATAIVGKFFGTAVV